MNTFSDIVSDIRQRQAQNQPILFNILPSVTLSDVITNIRNRQNQPIPFNILPSVTFSDVITNIRQKQNNFI